MKRLLFLLTMAIATINFNAHEFSLGMQSYRPMLKDGMVWKVSYNITMVDSIIDWTLYIDGDTIVDGERWYKMYYTWGGEHMGPALLQEEDGKIWQRCWQNAERAMGKMLIFDFTLGLGDSVVFDDELKMIVSCIDTINVDGELFRRITMSGYLSSEPEELRHLVSQSWIEGIGGESGPLNSRSQWGSGEIDIRLDSCFDNGRCIFVGDNFGNSPYHTQTALQDLRLRHSLKAPVFDLQGRRLSAPPARGVYIQDGRKKVAR